jgi:replicative DNA helicase
LILDTYHNVSQIDQSAKFGWPYMDEQGGGLYPGELVSFVGRPSLGKTWLTLWTALQNWQAGRNVLFASMEMQTLPVAQRIAAMFTGCNISQLKTAGYAHQMYSKFASSLMLMGKEQGKFYVVDGNLAASVEDIFLLADMLKCCLVVIDGGYLLKNKNPRLDRFTRVAENVEEMKRDTSDLDMTTVVSFQLKRAASEKQKKGNSEETGLEDIGYSDAIGQISSIVLGLFQEEGIETMKQRKIRVMKGRNGEIGQFSIAWNFVEMDFAQVDPPINGAKAEESLELQWV